MFSKLTRGSRKDQTSRSDNNERKSEKDASKGYSSSLINVLSTNSKNKYVRSQITPSSSSPPQYQSKVKLSVSNVNNQGLRFIQRPKRHVNNISDVRLSTGKHKKRNIDDDNSSTTETNISNRNDDDLIIRKNTSPEIKKTKSAITKEEGEEEKEQEKYHDKDIYSSNNDDVETEDEEKEQDEEEEECMPVESREHNDDNTHSSPFNEEQYDDDDDNNDNSSSESSEETFEDIPVEVNITEESNNQKEKNNEDNFPPSSSSPSVFTHTILTNKKENSALKTDNQGEEEGKEKEEIIRIDTNEKKRKRNEITDSVDKKENNKNKHNGNTGRHISSITNTLSLINYSHSKVLPIHQRKSVKLIKNEMGYKDITIAKEAVNAISLASVFFAELIINGTFKLKQIKKRKMISKDDVITTIIGTIPSSDFSMRLLTRLMMAVDKYNSYIKTETDAKEEEEEEEKEESSIIKTSITKRKSVPDEIRAGLSVKISHVNNLIKSKFPMLSGITKLSKIAIASCIEEMQREIIHRCVGRLCYSAIPSNIDDINDYKYEGEGEEEEEEEEKQEESKNKDISFVMNQVRFTIDLETVNIVLKKFVSMDTIKEIASEHKLFRHRKLDKEREIEKALKLNSMKERAKRRKKRDIKKRISRVIDKHNRENIMEPGEIIFLFMMENVLPHIFREFKLNGTRPIPNIRPDIAPERMKKKCRTKIAGEKNYVKNENTILLMLDFLATTYTQSENGRNWAPSARA